MSYLLFDRKNFEIYPLYVWFRKTKAKNKKLTRHSYSKFHELSLKKKKKNQNWLKFRSYNLFCDIKFHLNLYSRTALEMNKKVTVQDEKPVTPDSSIFCDISWPTFYIKTVGDGFPEALKLRPPQNRWKLTNSRGVNANKKKRAIERERTIGRKRRIKRIGQRRPRASATPSRERNVSILLQLSVEINYLRYAWMEFMHYSFSRVHGATWSYRDTFIRANRSSRGFQFHATVLSASLNSQVNLPTWIIGRSFPQTGFIVN